MELHPSRLHKWLFWLILGAYSTFFAEVFAGSDMFPFFNLWGILVVWPLYGLHTILLITIIFRSGKPSLPALVFCGMLFGLYEAWMTKVLWQPSWDAPLILAETAVAEVVVLVFWWHTWFSFITPLALGEQLLTGSQHVLDGLGGKLRTFYASWKGWLALLAFGGVYQSINSPSVPASLLSGISTVSFLLVLTLLWKRLTRGRQYSLPELLPDRRQFVVLAVWLGMLYLFLGFAMEPERIPGLAGQGVILLFYLVLILLLVRALHSSRELQQPAFTPPAITFKQWLLAGAGFVVVLGLSRALLAGASGIIILASWITGGVFGVALFLKAVFQLRRNSC